MVLKMFCTEDMCFTLFMKKFNCPKKEVFPVLTAETKNVYLDLLPQRGGKKKEICFCLRKCITHYKYIFFTSKNELCGLVLNQRYAYCLYHRGKNDFKYIGIPLSKILNVLLSRKHIVWASYIRCVCILCREIFNICHTFQILIEESWLFMIQI